MSTIEGGMVSTNDAETYEMLRMLRSHGMVREAAFEETKERYLRENPELNPKFIFAFPAYNLRNTEIGGILGRAQLKRLDEVVLRRTENQRQFLSSINADAYQTDFLEDGSSNYAFNLVLKNSDDELMSRLCAGLMQMELNTGVAALARQPVAATLYEGLFRERPRNGISGDRPYTFLWDVYWQFPDLSAAEVSEIVDIVNSAV